MGHTEAHARRPSLPLGTAEGKQHTLKRTAVCPSRLRLGRHTVLHLPGEGGLWSTRRPWSHLSIVRVYKDMSTLSPAFSKEGPLLPGSLGASTGRTGWGEAGEQLLDEEEPQNSGMRRDVTHTLSPGGQASP